MHVKPVFPYGMAITIGLSAEVVAPYGDRPVTPFYVALVVAAVLFLIAGVLATRNMQREAAEKARLARENEAKEAEKESTRKAEVERARRVRCVEGDRCLSGGWVQPEDAESLADKTYVCKRCLASKMPPEAVPAPSPST